MRRRISFRVAKPQLRQCGKRYLNKQRPGVLPSLKRFGVAFALDIFCPAYLGGYRASTAIEGLWR
jgi:hypothetical protein